MNFTEMQLKPQILRAIEELGFQAPTEIQEHAIPALLKSEDCHLLAQAKTGTGKTIAYAIPLAERIKPEIRKIQAIIMVPTRELCTQVYEVFTKLTKYCGITAVQVYGGVSIKNQIDKIRGGVHVVIATPGRLIDLYERRQVSLKNVRFVILDEADRMLDMGFMPDIEYLMFNAMQGITPRLLLFSATLKGQLSQMAEKFIGDKPKLEIDVSHDSLTVENCKQIYYVVQSNETKYEALVKVFHAYHPNRALIFVNTRRNAKKLLKDLRSNDDFGIKWDMIQGEMTQSQREKVMKNFREENINGLVATDVAARGLDIDGISHVINFDLPAFEENYVHRIGRTSRMDKQGMAISLCLLNQRKLIPKIEKFTSTKIERFGCEDNDESSNNLNPKSFTLSNSKLKNLRKLGSHPSHDSDRSRGGNRSRGGDRSFGSDRSRGGNRSRGGDRSFGSDRSHEGDRFHGPDRAHEGDRFHGPDRSHEDNRSPELDRAHEDNRSPEPDRAHEDNRSPEPDRSYADNRSHGPDRSHADNRSHGPDRSHGDNRSHGPDRSHADNRSHGPDRSHADNRSHGPDRSHADNRSPEPERSHDFNSKPRDPNSARKIRRSQEHAPPHYEHERTRSHDRFLHPRKDIHPSHNSSSPNGASSHQGVRPNDPEKNKSDGTETRSFEKTNKSRSNFKPKFAKKSSGSANKKQYQHRPGTSDSKPWKKRSAAIKNRVEQ